MPPGSISMTMKASGIGTVHGYSVFDGIFVNRGWLVLRLKMSEAEKSTVLHFIYSFFVIPYETFFEVCGILKFVFVFVRHCSLDAFVLSELFSVEQKSIGFCFFFLFFCI